MVADQDQSINVLRKTPGLSNLFHANVRRSRSLASLQREATGDTKRNPLGAYNSFNDARDHPIRPPLKQNKTVNSPDMQSRRWFANQSVSNISYLRTPSPPSRPKPAPRLWTEDDDEPDIKPSLLGLEAPGAPRSQPQARQPPYMSQNNYPYDIGYYEGNYLDGGPYEDNYQYEQPRSGYRQGRSLSRRRKQSVAELDLNPLSTVTEWSQESPSFPVRRNVRNNSDPSTVPSSIKDSVTPRASSADDSARTPVPAAASASLTPTAAKRASSMLLPIALAPLITSSPPEISSYNICSPEAAPPVPPKEPGYQPTPKLGSLSTASSVSHSAQSSLSELDYTVSSSVTTMSPADLPNTWPVELPGAEMPMSPKSMVQTESIEPPQEAAAEAPKEAAKPAGKDSSKDSSGMMPWVMKEFKAIPARKPVGNAGPAAESAITPVVDEKPEELPTLPPLPTLLPTAKLNSPRKLHQRNMSDSVLNRGRPTRRGNQHRPQRTISRDLRLANITGTLNDLPSGYNKMQALTTFTPEQLNDMRREADCEASGFEVLEARDVLALRKELDLLNGHCDELRRRAVSLRETRQQTHERLIAFLKTPGAPLVSREYILKQETEVSEVEVKIDDTAAKLEAAQTRRTNVQRKMLEHMAAMLALKIPGMGSTEEQTPPRSPEDEPQSIVIAMDEADLAMSPENEADEPSGIMEIAAQLERAEAEKLEAEEREYIERIEREREAEEQREREQQEEAEQQQRDLAEELARQQKERSAKASRKKASPKKSPRASPKKVSPREQPPRKDSLKKANSKKATPKKATTPSSNKGNSSSPAAATTEEATTPPSAAETGDLPLLLTQQRYEPPTRTTSRATERPASPPPAAVSPAPAKVKGAAALVAAAAAAPVTVPLPTPVKTTAMPPTPESLPMSATTDGASPRDYMHSIQIYADGDLYCDDGQDGMESLLSSIEQEIDAIDRQRTASVY